MRRTRLTVLALLLALVPVWDRLASADDPWDALVRGVDRNDPAAVAAARRKAERGIADFWFVVRPASPLLAEVARDLSASEVGALFDQAGDDVPRLEALLGNLSARDDAAALVVRRGLVERVAFDPNGPIVRMALDAVVAGEPDLAQRLLAQGSVADALGEDLADLEHAAGIQVLADVVRGTLPLAEAARARLVEIEPDLHNRYIVRPLGSERIRDLHRVATTDPDPGLRVLAARLLHASLDPEAAPVLVDAYAGAQSWRIDVDEWERLGVNHGLPPGLERSSLPQRQAVLHGHVVLGHVRAGQDPDGAAALAIQARNLWRRLEDPRARGHLLRFLDVWSYVFVDAARARPWAAPVWLELVSEWERMPREGDDGLALLARRVAVRARTQARTPYQQRSRSSAAHPPPTLSPVAARLPAAGAAGSVTPESISQWLALDPFHLTAPEVDAALRSWGPADAARVLDLYPDEVLRRLLAEPPTRWRTAAGPSPEADDATGRVVRARLLALLALSPARLVRLLEPAAVRAWPGSSRFDLASLVVTRALTLDSATLSALLADFEFARGYASAGLAHASEPALDFATRVLAGVEGRPELRAALGDMEEGGPEVRLGPVDGTRHPLTEELSERLGRMLAEEPDPWLADWIANRLSWAGGAAPEEMLLRHAPRLGLTDARGSHPLTDLDPLEGGAQRLEALLDFVGRPASPPDVAVSVYAVAVSSLLDPDEDWSAGTRAALVARLLAWTAERAGSLDPDRAEGVLLALLAARVPTDDPRRHDVDAVVAGALPRLGVPGVRLRVERALAAARGA